MMSHHAAIVINQSDIETKNRFEKKFSLSRRNHFWAERIFLLFRMVGFNFDTGGRRCIRPILEKYQSGRVDNIRFIGIFLIFARWMWRIHCENQRRELYDFKLSFGADGIFIWPETRKVSSTQNSLSSISRYDYLPTGVSLLERSR